MPRKKRLQKYYTAFVTDVLEARRVNALISGTDWGFSMVNDPSRCHWSNLQGGRSTFAKPEYAPPGTETYDEPSKCLILAADTETTADNLNALIHAGILLGYPDVTKTPEPISPWKFELGASLPGAWQPFAHYDNLSFGCVVAAKAFGNRSLMYAIEKYRHSIYLDSFTPHSANPKFGQIFANARDDFSYHVRAANAITVAYSVIEELGLTINSGPSKGKERFIDGQWNQKLVSNLSNRLVEMNMKCDLKFGWIYRGDSEAIELSIKENEMEGKRPPVHLARLYPDSTVVRDLEMNLIDAIDRVGGCKTNCVHRSS